MSQQTPGRLYGLLPAVYRIRDAGEDQPLRALFAVIEQELLALEQDIAGLYENWFIETCEEWVVPYIGDLLKVPALHTGGFGTFSLRAYIANVLAYRRRKGTASVLEQMANDVTGWTARVVEFQKLLATTQHVNHIRPRNARTPDLRDTNALELLGGPFENACHAVDVRHAASGRGRYNIPNIGIFLWRLQSYHIERSEAYSVAPGRYTFDPLGAGAPLFNRPRTEDAITHAAEECNVPAPLRRRPLYEELLERRSTLLENKTPRPVSFGAQPVFEVYLGASAVPLAPEELAICDLSEWRSPSAGSDVKALVDPRLGRLAISGVSGEVRVSYAYGFSGDVGGGPYGRSESLAGVFGKREGADQQRIWWAGVSKDREAQRGRFSTLGEAVDEWNRVSAAETAEAPTHGVIAVLDSSTYVEDLAGAKYKIVVRSGRTLLIAAAQWRGETEPVPADWNGDLNALLVADGLRPVVKGDIQVQGGAAAEKEPGQLLLSGLLIDGVVTVLQGDLGELTLSHCTVKPAPGGGILVESGSGSEKNDDLTITLDRSICGPIQAPRNMKGLRIIDSIIDSAVDPDEDGYPAPAISAGPAGSQTGPAATIERSTIFGTVAVREITRASETIFTEPVTAERLQTGCVRYSFVPLGSSAPRRYRCQPDLALAALAKARGREPDEAERESAEERLWPVHTSTDYGDPGYGRLSPACPEEIRTGAEDGSEMGVFCHLKQPQREANLRINLEEYLRFGMEAGIFYVN